MQLPILVEEAVLYMNQTAEVKVFRQFHELAVRLFCQELQYVALFMHNLQHLQQSDNTTLLFCAA